MPKYQIEAHGKTLFEWAMLSLKGYFAPENRCIFIVRAEDNAADFIQKKAAELNMGEACVVELDAPTDGQATSVMRAQPHWRRDDALMIYNIDTFVEPGELKPEDISGDGYLPCFHAAGAHWSFVKLGEDGDAVEVREKTRISDNCTLGAYYFKSCALYEGLYADFFSGGGMEHGEKYIAPMYNDMIRRGMPVRISLVDANKVHVLGTPEELDAFQKLEGIEGKW